MLAHPLEKTNRNYCKMIFVRKVFCSYRKGLVKEENRGVIVSKLNPFQTLAFSLNRY